MKSQRLLPALTALSLCASSLPAWSAPATPAPAAAPEAPGQEQPSLKGPTGAAEVPLKRKKAVIGTLMHVHSEPGEVHPGSYVRITITALPGKTGTPDELGYDRFLGPMTMKSLDAVIQPVSTLHKGWPRGEKLQISFTDRPSPSELLPSSAAMALLLDSMIRDWDIEPNLAVFGTMQPDGSIDAVGGIPHRLTGAALAHVARIVVPEKNALQVADYLLGQGIASFVGTQIFTAKDFNEAGLLATVQLDDQVKEAMTLFGAVQRTLLAAGGGSVALLRNERVQATLQSVLAKAPNHLSAKVLHDWGTGQHSQMSFDGSVDVIDRFAPDLIRALHAKPEEALKTPRQALVNNIAGLKYADPRLDPKARGYAEALLRYGDVLQRAIGTSSAPKRVPGTLQKDFDAAREQGNAEWTKMAEARMNSTPEK